MAANVPTNVTCWSEVNEPIRVEYNCTGPEVAKVTAGGTMRLVIDWDTIWDAVPIIQLRNRPHVAKRAHLATDTYVMSVPEPSQLPTHRYLHSASGINQSGVTDSNAAS